MSLKDELLRAEQNTDKYLSGLPTFEAESQNRIRSQLGTSRQKFLGNLAGVDQRSIGSASGRLGSEVDRTLSRRSMTSNRNTLQRKYETLVSRLEMSGVESEKAKEYARQYILDEMERESMASETQADIAFGRRKDDMTDKYQRMGLELQDQYAPKVDYESALTRSLFGIGGAAATYGLLGGFKKPQQQETAYDFGNIKSNSGYPSTGSTLTPRTLDFQGSRAGFNRFKDWY